MLLAEVLQLIYRRGVLVQRNVALPLACLQLLVLRGVLRQAGGCRLLREVRKVQHPGGRGSTAHHEQMPRPEELCRVDGCESQVAEQQKSGQADGRIEPNAPEKAPHCADVGGETD